MSLLDQAKKSPMMRVRIRIGDETIKFNLAEELNFSNENNMDAYVKNHATQYSFLLMVRSKLIKIKNQAEKEAEELYSKAWAKAKNESTGGRAPANDLCDHKAKVNKKYVAAINILNSTKENLNDVEACIKGFETRKDLLQTLSANRRKEI